MMRLVPTILRRNWRFKLLALGLALVSWTLVVYANNPPGTRTYSVDVPVASLSGRFVLLSKPEPISVRVDGSKENLDAFDPSRDLEVVVDLNGIAQAGRQEVPLQVIDHNPSVSLDQPPTSATVDVDRLASRTVSVEAQVTPPPAGYVYQTPTLTPATVVVSGASRELEGLRAVVPVDLSKAKTDYTGGGTIRIVDALNNTVTAVGVVPGLAVTYHAVITASQTQRTVPIDLRPQGQVGQGRYVESMVASPLAVTLSGPQDLLNTIDNVAVDVPIAGLTQTQTVTLPVPYSTPGVGGDVQTVSVKITVQSQAIPTGIPPTPLPTTAPTPAPSATPTPRPPTPTPGPSPAPTPSSTP